jgi:acetyl esterase/lipase
MTLDSDHAVHDAVVDDIEYRRGDDGPLLARLYRPRGSGPFPAVVGIHGGAWTSGDRLNNAVLDGALAAAGAIVLALDFRAAPQSPYPASVADIHFGIRWLKAHAAEFGSKPEWVGAVGSSSGAHQMLLNVLRPRDPRYAALDAPALEGFDAEVAYVVACWPIADPLARYRMAQQRGNDRLVKSHDAYFGGEAAMTEANPQTILERSVVGSLPPLLVLQGTNDDNVTPDMAEKFVHAWRAGGGRAQLEVFEGQPHSFVTREPDSAASKRAIALATEFVLHRGANRS